MTSYVLAKNGTRLMAHRNSQGQHDGLVTDDVADAAEFPTYGACADYGQNFDDSWQPQPTHLPSPGCAQAVRMVNDQMTGGR